MMIFHKDTSDTEIRQKIKENEICYGGNSNLKIYGKLNCVSGKRMKTENRVFFRDEVEAIQRGYRPCGHCMREEYHKWMNQN